ncbi:hypothetical protein N9H48_07545 [Pseudoalteromonas marina]|nr:hypothetical protein [Pseudoalteromonas marina]
MYFIESMLKINIATNRLLLLAGLPLILLYINRLKLTNIDITIFSLCLCCFALGAWYLPEFERAEIISIIGVVFPFVIGVIAYDLFHEDKFKKYLLIVCTFSTLISLISVSEVFPSIFKIESQLHMIEGVLVSRPEVFTDQNFHVMYTFWLIPLYPFLTSRSQKVLWAVLVLANFYVLSAIQTRSGLLYSIFCILIFLHIFGKLKFHQIMLGSIIFFTVLTLLYVLFFDFIVETTIYSRFTLDNGTGSHRVESFTFWIYKLFDFSYWVPYGNSEFDYIYGGNIPHANITAFYLNGGIVALVAYFYLIVRPMVLSWVTSYKLKLSAEEMYVVVSAITIFAIQSSLNLPYNEQVWFWAGMTIAMLNSLKTRTVPINSMTRLKL